MIEFQVGEQGMSIVIASLLAVIVLFLGYFARQYVIARRTFRDFITPEAENEPSPFALLVSSSADVFSRSVAAQVKSTFMAKQGADNRAERVVEADMAEDLLSAKSPFLASLLNSFPTLRKTLRRNPALVDIAAQKLLEKVGHTAPSSNHEGESVSFKFKA